MHSINEETTQFLAEDGTIDYGKLVRFYRKVVLQWSNAQTLADLCNEVLGQDEEVTARWVQRMEQNNKIPLDEKRRWILATILNIPPAYFGLTNLQPLATFYNEMKLPISTRASSLDVREYASRLNEFWTSTIYNSDTLDEVLRRIYTLQEAALYGATQQKERVSHLLCHYLVLAGNMQRGQGHLTSAIACLNNAVALAKEKNYADLTVKALYLRSYSYSERWSVSQDKEKDRIDLLKGTNDIYDALKLADETHVQGDFTPYLKGAIFELLANLLAHNARDLQDRRIALQTVDRAGSMMSSSGLQRDPYFLQINTEWYHIGKAETQLALHQPKSALEEIALLQGGNPHRLRRYLSANIVEAQAYVAKGQIEVGTAYAEDALEVATKLTSPIIHISRIDNIYRSLRQDDKNKNNPDVARLGIKLFKVHHPEIFV